MKSFRPTLSVLTTVHGNGGLTAAALAIIRPLADEIVVAYDSRTPHDQLGPLESVVDLLIGFEFTGPNRFRPWLREQARGDWLLLLDGDEVVSTELLRLIPEMISNRNVSGYVSPCWWVYPDPTTRLVSAPWGDDRHLRLARNDGRLWFPGTKHTGAEQDSPLRFLDAPIIHLDLVINSMAVRCDKVARYDDQQFPMFAPNGRLINETYYLPERDPSVTTCQMPASDAERVAAVLACREDRHAPTKLTSVVSAAEVDRWWAGRPSSQFDYAAEIAVVRGDVQFPAKSTVFFELEVANLGQSVWPETRLARGREMILLAYHWKRHDGSMAIYDGRRSGLTSRVTPGERVRLSAMVDAPPEPGRYKLVFDLVYEHVRWFCIDHEIDVIVEPSIRDQLAGTGGLVAIPIKAARAARQRLQIPDGLSIAMQPDHEEVLNSPVDLPLGGWALDGSVLNYLLTRVGRENITRILEFGSGTSTVVLAHEIASRKGMILSLDQDPAYAAQTVRSLTERGLETRCRIVAVGLAETFEGGARTRCYALAPDIERDIRAFDPDLIVIDGPSQASGASRLAVAPMIARLVERPTPFVMDDAFRDAELEIADRWQQESGIEVDGILAIGKGLLIGRLCGRSDFKNSCSTPAATKDSPQAELRGACTFFSDPRAICVAGYPLVGAVDPLGSVLVGWFGSDRLRSVSLRDGLEADDHGNPAFLIRRSDSRILAFHSRHVGPISTCGADATYLCLSTHPNDPTSWGAAIDLTRQLGGTAYGYANPVQLLGEAGEPIFNFLRCASDADGTCMHYSRSDDGGETWTAAVKLARSRSPAYSRPYFRVARNGDHRIDFCINDGHPNERTSNSVYHFYFEGGNWFASDGTTIGNPPFFVSEDFTRVFDGTTAAGSAWVWSIEIGTEANPVIVYAAFPAIGDHRYRYARWSGSAWVDHEVTAAGVSLYPGEPYYSGGICLDPENVNIVYYSRKVDDVFQLFQSVTEDGGAGWVEKQLTHSEDHCFRPYVVRGLRKLCYVSGTYTSYNSYDTHIKIMDIV